MFRKILCAAGLLIGSVFGAHAAPTLSLTPATSSVAVGDTFTLQVAIAGVSDLYAWQLDLGWTPANLLSASPATEGPFLGAGTTFDGGTVDNTAGTIELIFSSLSGLTGVSGDGILASIEFEALAEGLVTVSLSNVILIDSNLDQIFFDTANDAFAATVDIGRDGTVPEPSTLALAVLALGVASRRRLVGGLTGRRRVTAASAELGAA